jgi:chemotaxis family two-component system sensor kinase Cph1
MTEINHLNQGRENLVYQGDEAIHYNNQIQPHGILLVLTEPDLAIVQVSENASRLFDIPLTEIFGKTLDELLDPFQTETIKQGLSEDNLDFINPTKVWARKTGDEYVVFDAVFYRNSDGLLILELEPAIARENIPFLSFYHLAKTSIKQLLQTVNLKEFCEVIVQEVRKVTGFDRVMLYKFEPDGHGVVIAEEKIPELDPYLGLHYPESDIPQAARKLFASNWIRLIPDSRAEGVSLVGAAHLQDRHPIDLTHSILRSAAGCHLEYLHNMGVGASLTISLIKDNKLWGLIACHHRTSKYVPYELRKACEFLGQVIFSEISAREETEDYNYRMKLSYIQTALVDYMSNDDNFIQGLVEHQPNLLELTSAKGAAILFGNKWTVIGKVPSEEDLNLLVQWLRKNVEDEVFHTDSLARIYPDADKYKDVASGLLAIPIPSKNYVIWFKPEVVQTLNWGGNPNHAYQTQQGEGSIKRSPRKSFDLWKETVRLKSLPWQPVEIKAALELRKAIINIILRQADELAQLAHDLARSNSELKKFAYVASHDLQEPLNQVANYVQLLELRYNNQLDTDAKEFIGYAVQGVHLMQTLIDDVLAYSRVDTQAIEFELTDVQTALDMALGNLRKRIKDNEAVITSEPLPTVMADKTQMMQLFQNLIGNAIKFRSTNPPKIYIGATRLEDEWLFSVQDNGIGIDPQFFERIFIIFQRLHTRDEYPGTGMGLAICKKIVECHRGRIWVESEPDKGAKFYFTIPVGGRERDLRRERKA